MFNKSDISRNACQLFGTQAKGLLGDTPSYLMVKAGAWGEDAA